MNPRIRIRMSDSWGLALQAGINHAIGEQWGLFASVARVDVQSEIDVVVDIPGVPVPVTAKTKVEDRP
jgi:outer membrane protein W